MTDLQARAENIVREVQAGLVRGRHIDRHTRGPVTIGLAEVQRRTAHLVIEEMNRALLPRLDDLIDRVAELSDDAEADRLADEAKAAVRRELASPGGIG